MIIYNISTSDLVLAKAEQMRYIGLTPSEFENVYDVLESAIVRTHCEEKGQINNLWKNSKTSNLSSQVPLLPLALTLNLKSGDYYQYNINGGGWLPQEAQIVKPVTRHPAMKYSSEKGETACRVSFQNSNPKLCITKVHKPVTLQTKRQPSNSCLSGLMMTSKLSLLRRVLEGIFDDDQILIAAKPKNRSQKIRRSNRHSRFRGVSLNGKKWQVMIMGPLTKKYFGGISSERDAAIFYDKLCILTNGLGAKTNFNYRKYDLSRMMSELERMEHLIAK